MLARHGQSCGNAVSEIKGNRFTANGQRGHEYRDPPLTAAGRQASVVNGEKMLAHLHSQDWFKEGVNLVCSSVMLRAIESAHFMTSRWPKKPANILVVPLLSESGAYPLEGGRSGMSGNPESVPMPLDAQKAALASKFITNVDFKAVEGANAHMRHAGSNIEDFVSSILPGLLNAFIAAKGHRPVINVLLVSHQAAIQKTMGITGEMRFMAPVANNGALSASFDFRPGENVIFPSRFKPLIGAKRPGAFDVPEYDTVYPTDWSDYEDCAAGLVHNPERTFFM